MMTTIRRNTYFTHVCGYSVYNSMLLQASVDKAIVSWENCCTDNNNNSKSSELCLCVKLDFRGYSPAVNVSLAADQRPKR